MLYKDGEERWWLEITGKGDKIRIVPATNELMVELARYRREQGLTSFPLLGDTTPLLLPIGGKNRPMTRSAVHPPGSRKRFSSAQFRLGIILNRAISYHLPEALPFPTATPPLCFSNLMV